MATQRHKGALCKVKNQMTLRGSLYLGFIIARSKILDSYMPCRMMENSIAVPSAETEALSKAAKDNSIVVCIGCSERVTSGPGRGTLYNTQLTFGTRTTPTSALY
jgi:hypothetical protein